jgi:hypothetical protein
MKLPIQAPAIQRPASRWSSASTVRPADRVQASAGKVSTCCCDLPSPCITCGPGVGCHYDPMGDCVCDE